MLISWYPPDETAYEDGYEKIRDTSEKRHRQAISHKVRLSQEEAEDVARHVAYIYLADLV